MNADPHMWPAPTETSLREQLAAERDAAAADRLARPLAANP